MVSAAILLSAPTGLFNLRDAEEIKQGVVCGDVHIFIFGKIFDRDRMGAFGEFNDDGVGEIPVVPVGDSALRHHERSDFLAVDKERTDCGLVFGVDRTVAVGIADRERVATIKGDINID